ncbi:SHOCT domain-containing protein [Halomicrococcus sp. NG-SE-24]|uniref:SHOCT domain-containing protein n=1 Tax=Halomicrococcus sp. NG-SE-24 TaxID=3436928 RepID=UPI003D971F52
MATRDQTDSVLRVVLVLFALLLLLPVVMMVVAFPMMGGWMMGPGYGGRTPLWGWAMALVAVLVLLAVGYAVYRLLAGGESGGLRADPALEELRMAYARGDISEEEFESRQRRLRRDRD